MRAIAGDEVRIEAHDGERRVGLRRRVDARPLRRLRGRSSSCPKSAHLGDARVIAAVRGRRARRRRRSETFILAAYKASEFKVEAVRGREGIRARRRRRRSTRRPSTSSAAPMAGRDRAHHADAGRRRPSRPPGADGFVTHRRARAVDAPRPKRGRRAISAPSDGKLDAEGRVSRDAAPRDAGQRGPERVTFEAEVEDLSRTDGRAARERRSSTPPSSTSARRAEGALRRGGRSRAASRSPRSSPSGAHARRGGGEGRARRAHVDGAPSRSTATGARTAELEAAGRARGDAAT